MTTTMSMIGLLLAAIQYELEITTENTTKETYRNKLPKMTKAGTMCRLIIFISSWFSVGCMMMRQVYKYRLKALQNKDSHWINWINWIGLKSRLCFDKIRLCCGKSVTTVQEQPLATCRHEIRCSVIAILH